MCLEFREITNREVVVRKAHMCAWCAHGIPKSDPARYRVYVFDRELTTDWMHLDCYDAMTKSRSDVICEGWMAGDFERGEIAA